MTSRLKDLFVNLIFEKCVRFNDNQKQKERRALNLSLDPEPSQNASQEAHSELGHSTELTAHDKHGNSTACNQKDLGSASPVAQLIPREEETSHHGLPSTHATQKQPKTSSLAAIKSDNYLSGSDSEDSDSSTERCNELRKRIRRGRNGTVVRNKRIRSSPSQPNSPVKKQKTQKAEVNVRYLLSPSASRARLLASFQFPSGQLAAVLQGSCRHAKVRHAIISYFKSNGFD